MDTPNYTESPPLLYLFTPLGGMNNVTLQDLFPKDGKFTFLVGAGCSIEAPSCLPAGKQMMEAIIKFTCSDSEVDKILGISELRFEQLVEILRDTIDPDLKIIDYYGLCNQPNSQHFFLADMIKNGHYVITTNFDYLIEYALLNSDIDSNAVFPIITKQDFLTYPDPSVLFQENKYPIYKIHGSSKNIISGEDTKDNLVTTMQAFGSGKEGESVFQLEPHKRPVFENISRGRDMVVMGYSGSDDFDIVPTLKLLPELNEIVWINHTNDLDTVKIKDIGTIPTEKATDKIDRILKEIEKMGYDIQIFRIDGNTTRILREITPLKDLDTSNKFNYNPTKWFEQELKSSDDYIRDLISFRIYSALANFVDAERCVKRMLEKAQIQRDPNREALAHYELGLILFNGGSTYGEIEGFGHVLNANKIYKETGNKKGEAKALTFQGKYLEISGSAYLSGSFYKKSLTIHENLGDIGGKAEDLTDIGRWLVFFEHNYEKALANFKQALEIYEKLGDLTKKASSLNDIGICFSELGDNENAVNNYKDALRIHEETGNLRGKSHCINNLGVELYNQGEYSKALSNFEKALNIFENLYSVVENPLYNKQRDVTMMKTWIFYTKKKLEDNSVDFRSPFSNNPHGFLV